MLAGVRTNGYAYADGRDQPAQKHLGEVRQQLGRLVPPGMKILVSGSGQSLPVVPWIAVLDKDVTTTAQEGLYVVYLYRADLSCVYLSMNQGATQHKRAAEARGLKGVAAENAACEELLRESALIREGLSADALAGLLTEIDLGSGRFLPHAYECGSIAAVSYALAALPSEDVLRDDLAVFRGLYESSVEIKNEIRAANPTQLSTTAGSSTARKKPAPKPPMFRPKDSSSYVAYTKAHKQRRERRHEALIKAFGTEVKACPGFTVATNVHPRDMTVTTTDQHWLVEAKTVGSNPEHAVRAAIGQLMAYRHFLYREQNEPDPQLVALFSEAVGDAFTALLNSLGIEAIWQHDTGWAGSWGPGHENRATSLLSGMMMSSATAAFNAARSGEA